ncbi:unnamed protein product [Citrullus colocynthis]|uniref:Uncharacterized protein n=1 Tax=Citrullus colocynthis TaxID=252529 RepID=A0ABP0XXU3_9ROSI
MLEISALVCLRLPLGDLIDTGFMGWTSKITGWEEGNSRQDILLRLVGVCLKADAVWGGVSELPLVLVRDKCLYICQQAFILYWRMYL